MRRLIRRRRDPNISTAQRLADGAESANSDRTYRRYVKAIRDQAQRSVATSRMALPGAQAQVQILEMPDGSLNTLVNTRRLRRPHRVSHLTGDDATIARNLLDTHHRQIPEEQCCNENHPPGHCHRLLPHGAECWQCAQET